jgi:hypothetical protein
VGRSGAAFVDDAVTRVVQRMEAAEARVAQLEEILRAQGHSASRDAHRGDVVLAASCDACAALSTNDEAPT